MPQEFADYIDFIENFVLPLREKNPDAYSLDGRSSADPRPVEWPNGPDLFYGNVRYTANSDAVIDRLLAPYKAWNGGEVEYPVRPGKTERGADALISTVAASEHLYIYLKPGASNKRAVQSLYEQGRSLGKDSPPVGVGSIDAKETESVRRKKRDEDFRRRVLWYWGANVQLQDVRTSRYSMQHT